MNFSVGSWSFHELYEADKINLFGYLQALKYRYQLSSADIWTGMMTSTADDYVRKVQQTLKEESMTVACLATDATVWHDNPEMRKRNRATIDQYIEIASTLGAETLRIDIGIQSTAISDEQFSYAAETYRHYAGIAQSRGFRLGPQTHQPAMQVPSNVERMVKAVANPAFGVIIDVERWVEDIESGDERCAPYAMLVHFDSSRTTTRQRLEQKVSTFLQADYQGCWSLEYRLGGSEYLGVAADLAELRRTVHQLSQ